MTPYYRRRGHEVRTAVGDVLYIRADHPDKAERICKALNALAKLEAKNAACGWPTAWAGT
jgi:hypothetical protein